MRHIVAVALAGLSLSGAGCTLMHDAASMTTYRVCESVQDYREDARNHRWAEQAWQNVRRCNPHAKFSPDYADGFRDGFSDFLYRGGSGEPPPLPPRHYRKVAYQTPEGYQAIEDWFDGYRHGAATARESGYRELVTGPSAVRGPAPVGPPLGVEPAEPPLSVEVPLPPPTPVTPPPLPAGIQPAGRILGVRPASASTAEPAAGDLTPAGLPPAELPPTTAQPPAELPAAMLELPPGIKPTARITGVRPASADLPAEPPVAVPAPPPVAAPPPASLPQGERPAAMQLPVIRSAAPRADGPPPAAIQLPTIRPLEARPAVQLPVIRSAVAPTAPPRPAVQILDIQSSRSPAAQPVP